MDKDIRSYGFVPLARRVKPIDRIARDFLTLFFYEDA